jgi:archaellum component FlaG (FlaF/FlaG flagellin family)
LKRYVVMLAVAAFVVATMAVPALAAPQGKSEQGVDTARSICAYSGLNDEPDSPTEGGQVQSYGQIVKAGGKAFVPSPGDACNPTKGFEE